MSLAIYFKEKENKDKTRQNLKNLFNMLEDLGIKWGTENELTDNFLFNITLNEDSGIVIYDDKKII